MPELRAKRIRHLGADHLDAGGEGVPRAQRAPEEIQRLGKLLLELEHPSRPHVLDDVHRNERGEHARPDRQARPQPDTQYDVQRQKAREPPKRPAARRHVIFRPACSMSSCRRSVRDRPRFRIASTAPIELMALHLLRAARDRRDLPRVILLEPLTYNAGRLLLGPDNEAPVRPRRSPQSRARTSARRRSSVPPTGRCRARVIGGRSHGLHVLEHVHRQRMTRPLPAGRRTSAGCRWPGTRRSPCLFRRCRSS